MKPAPSSLRCEPDAVPLNSLIDETAELCVTLDDITEKRVLERRLAQKEKAALLESLVGGIAHELKNKLSPILGYAELLTAELGQSQANPALQGYCETIRQSAHESAKIIRQLPQLSRPPAPEMTPDEPRRHRAGSPLHPRLPTPTSRHQGTPRTSSKPAFDPG
jgi:signal transduction histidine kinase